MIKRLRAQNFLSLRDFEIQLGRRNVLVGPNMAGKTNLIHCFKFLTQIAQKGLGQTLMDEGGFDEVIWKGSRPDDRVRLKLEGEGVVDNEPAAFDYEISILGSPSGFTVIESEKLVGEIRGKTAVLVDMKSGQGTISKADGTRISNTTGAPNSTALEQSIPGWEGTAFKNYVLGWRFYDLVPQLMKQTNAAVLQTFLAERGQNLSSWFMTLFTRHKEEANRIRQAALDTLPELLEVLTPPTQFATTFLVAQERHLKDNVSVFRMADGELVFLAFLSLIFAPQELGSPLVCVEEPENHIHPRLLETLVELQSQVAKELGSNAAQIVVTTHSPILVNQVGIEDLVVLERKNGETIWTRPSSKTHLRDLLAREEVGLGELWYSGALGGV